LHGTEIQFLRTTACVSMQAMRREELTDVLSNDHHFTQEGFHILFT